MNLEVIKDIVVRLVIREPVTFNEIYAAVMHYVHDTTGKEINHIVAQQIVKVFGVDKVAKVLMTHYVGHAKILVMKLSDAQGEVIKVWVNGYYQ